MAAQDGVKRVPKFAPNPCPTLVKYAVNPIDHIDATLRAILDGHTQSGIKDLMPWRYKKTSTLAA